MYLIELVITSSIYVYIFISIYVYIFAGVLNISLCSNISGDLYIYICIYLLND